MKAKQVLAYLIRLHPEVVSKFRNMALVKLTPFLPSFSTNVI